MFNSKGKQLTELKRIFLEPADPTHRQYEALRAYFVDGPPLMRSPSALTIHPVVSEYSATSFAKTPNAPS
jgi:hypothetical protein